MIDDRDIEKLKEAFVTKKEFEGMMEVVATKDDLKNFATKDDLNQVEERLENKITEFKSEILDGQDEILKELKTLSQEKIVSDEQDKRKTKVLEIHNNALKSNKILSDQQSLEIDNLHVF